MVIVWLLAIVAIVVNVPYEVSYTIQNNFINFIEVYTTLKFILL